MEYNVIINRYTNDGGWVSDDGECVDTFYYPITAETYYQSLDDDELESYLKGSDGIIIVVVAGDGNEKSSYWVDAI